MKNYNHKGDILVVDDQLENVRLLADMLQNNGYEVRQVIDGNHALKVAEYDPPELILLDIMMPDISGYEVCQKLKYKSSTQNIPIIFISARTNFLDKVKAFQMGGVDYITKPFFLPEVLCRVETHVTIYRQRKSLIREIAEKQKIQAKLEAANKELERLANIDGLTEIANRRLFDEYLSQEWHRLKREQLPLSLIMIDVDSFKLYNDTYRHLAGDNCLKNIAQTINHVVKRPADLVARYGGEEFAVILPNTPLEGAVEVAKNISTEIRQLGIIHEKSSVSEYVTLSLGIASLIPTAESSPSYLIDIADKALSQAKQEGKNRFVVFNSEF